MPPPALEVRAAALERVGQHLAHDRQQGQALVRPGHAPAHAVEAQRPDQPARRDERHADDRLHALRGQQRALGGGLRRQLGQAGGVDALVAAHLLHPPGEGLEGQLLHRVLQRIDALRAPLVGVADPLPAGREHEDVAAVDAREAADLGQRAADAGVDLVHREVDELGRQGRHQPLEGQAVLQRAQHGLHVRLRFRGDCPVAG
jgi:hypothetical protein